MSGFQTFQPGQLQAVTQVLASESTLVCLPTGGGKSLCYQVEFLLLLLLLLLKRFSLFFCCKVGWGWVGFPLNLLL